VDDSVMDVHIETLLNKLIPEHLRSNVNLTRHDRNSSYNPQLVEDADLVLVGVPDTYWIGKGCYEEIKTAIDNDIPVLAIFEMYCVVYVNSITNLWDDFNHIDSNDYKEYAKLGVTPYNSDTKICFRIDPDVIDMHSEIQVIYPEFYNKFFEPKIEIGMWIECPPKCNSYLTPGKLYKIIEYLGSTYKIIDDSGNGIHTSINGCAHSQGVWKVYKANLEPFNTEEPLPTGFVLEPTESSQHDNDDLLLLM